MKDSWEFPGREWILGRQSSQGEFCGRDDILGPELPRHSTIVGK